MFQKILFFRGVNYFFLKTQVMSDKSQAHRRLIQDFKKIQSDAPEGIEATPSESNISVLFYSSIYN